jgi:hypothetical protein
MKKMIIPMTNNGITTPMATFAPVDRLPEDEETGGVVFEEEVGERDEVNNEVGSAARPRVGRGEF